MTLSDDDLAQRPAATIEARRQAWIDAKPGRAILKEGLYLVALENGHELESHLFLAGLVDLLESR